MIADIGLIAQKMLLRFLIGCSSGGCAEDYCRVSCPVSLNDEWLRKLNSIKTSELGSVVEVIGENRLAAYLGGHFGVVWGGFEILAIFF